MKYGNSVSNGDHEILCPMALESRHSGGLFRPSSRLLNTGKKPDDHSVKDQKSVHYDASVFPLSLIQAVTKEDLNQVMALLSASHDIEIRHPINERTGAIISASLGYSRGLKGVFHL
jgi:hypothetical protein